MANSCFEDIEILIQSKFIWESGYCGINLEFYN